MINQCPVFLIIILFIFNCSQKEMIFSAKQVKYSENKNSIERELIHEECNKTTSNELKNLNYLSIEAREKLKSKSIDNFMVSRKIKLIGLIPTFLNLSAIYEECYKLEGNIKK